MYLIHSTVRHVRKRLLRKAHGGTQRRTQFVLDTQQRLVPKRPIEISEADLERNLDHLKDLERKGIIEMTTKDGRFLHLNEERLARHPPVVPLPNFRQDSATNDPPRGRLAHFEPDGSEPLPPDPAPYAGGGLTEEALARAAAEAKSPLLTPEEQAALEDGTLQDTPEGDEGEPGTDTRTTPEDGPPPVDEAALDAAFGPTGEEEGDSEDAPEDTAVDGGEDKTTEVDPKAPTSPKKSRKNRR